MRDKFGKKGLPSIFPKGLEEYQDKKRPGDRCGKCGKVVNGKKSDYCWFCGESLCPDCWDMYGECGHKGAIMTNKYSRREISAEELVEYRKHTTLEAQLEIVKRTDSEST